MTAQTGDQTAATPEDFLKHPAQYSLPQVQHIEYSVDGHLDLVLP